MRVYLAGPINGCTDAEANDWRTATKALLAAVGHEAVDPMARDYRGKEDENVNTIVQGDLRDIARCQAMIVNAARPSWGTAMEVYIASVPMGVRVIAVVPSGPVSPWLRFYAQIVQTFPEAVAALDEVFA